MKRKTLLLICTVLLHGFLTIAMAQSIQVTGKVTSTANEPLAGATVAVKGTGIATTTDDNGNFTLNVPQLGSVVVVSFAGMASQEMTVNSAGTLNFSLVNTSGSLNEVVVVGYGTQRRRTLTSAISSVKASDLESMPVYRIEQSLQGRVSGVTIAASSGQPGSGSTVRVRGTTSINNSDPLYVVDGIPVDVGGIDYLNQNDIESIEVLKDAASAAIYGARAASGVILVTTKKGRSGTMQINYNAYYGTQAPARKLNLLNAREYAILRNEAIIAGTPDGQTPAIPFANPDALGEGTDWQDVIFNNDARIQDHQISISGGGEKSTFYGSFGYFDQDGIVATDISQYKRFTVRFNSTHKIRNWLSFGNNVGYSHIKAKGLGNTNSEFGGPLSSAINLDPVTPIVITDPTELATSPYNNPNLNLIRDANGNHYAISKYVVQEMTNPLAYIKTREGNYGWSDNLVGNVYLEVEPVKNLRIRSNVGSKLAFWGAESFTPMYYLNAASINSNTSFFRELNRGFNWTWENTASYLKTFGMHQLSALVGTGAYFNSARGTNSTYRNLPVDNFKDASMNFSLGAADRIAGGWENVDHKVSSVYGRLTYSYDDKYLFTGILRRDGSTRFGANNKYGFFPSVSAGWVASREDFWPSNDVISFLKIRGSYGVNGNDNLPNFAYVATVSGGRNYTFGNDQYLIGYSPNAPANPDLQWEETIQSNLGFEASIFRNFSVIFDVYNKKTTGMLQPIILPGYVGVSGQPFGNVASMKNTGFELELGYNKRLGDVVLDLKGNVSHINNEITDLGTVKFRTGAGFQSSNYEISRLTVGQPIGAFYGFQIDGIFQNQAEVDSYVDKNGNKIQPNARPGDFRWSDLNGDGLITGDSDRTFIGDPTPDWSFGFTTSASWKGFDMVVFGQGVTGNQIFNGLRRLDIPSANYTTAALGRWTGEGTSNDFPRLVQGDPNANFSNPSSFYLSDGAYFRIKTLQIGYSLPKDLISRIGLQRARVYVGSNNLVTFTNYTGFDPEIGGGSYGIDRGFYPQARSYMVGVNLSL